MAYKTSDKGSEAEETYKVKYAAKIKKLQEDEPEVMLELLHYGEMALMCYCPADKFCHRHLLVEEFTKLGEANNVEVVYMGEIK